VVSRPLSIHRSELERRDLGMTAKLDPQAKEQLKRFKQDLGRFDGFVRNEIASRVEYWRQAPASTPRPQPRRMVSVRNSSSPLLILIFLTGFAVGYLFNQAMGAFDGFQVPEAPFSIPHIEVR
jgi:hypothetical protein